MGQRRGKYTPSKLGGGEGGIKNDLKKWIIHMVAHHGKYTKYNIDTN